MDQATYQKHKPYAGEKKPSMHRRRTGHDYSSRRMYLITMTIEGRRPLLGTLVGTEQDARVELSELGRAVQAEWMAVQAHHPEIEALALQIMPDHLHGILFVQQQMDQHLGLAIRGFKASTNKHYRRLVLGLPAAGAGAAPAALGAAPAAGAAAAPGAATPSQQSQPAPSPYPPSPALAAPSPSPSTPITSPGSPSPSPSTTGPLAAGPSGVAGAPVAAPQVGFAATVSQLHQPRQPQQPQHQPQPPCPPKRDRRLDNREHGLLWSPNYNDHILAGQGELQRWLGYLHDNPRRLLVKRLHPEYFRVRFGLTVASRTYDAIGNQALLLHPEKLQVQCSRSLTDQQIADRQALFLARARSGAVLVSPAISRGEKLIMRAALDAGLRLIFLSAEGFTRYTKPGAQFFDTCASGQLLILSPWGHDNQKHQLSRAECLALNDMTQTICHYEPSK